MKYIVMLLPYNQAERRSDVVLEAGPIGLTVCRFRRVTHGCSVAAETALWETHIHIDTHRFNGHSSR